MLLIILAAAVSQLDQCAAAVHGDLASAATVCATPKESINLLDPSTAPQCPDALTAGVQAGKYGPKMPDVIRNGLIGDFDKKLAACHAPKGAPLPQIKTVQEWN